MGTRSDKPTESRFPSLNEFGGWYNLGYVRPDGLPVLDSRDDVPEFEHGEFVHLRRSEQAWFDQLVPAEKLKPFDPVAGPPMYVYCEADDRTFVICPDFDYVTLDLIHRIQSEFLGKYAFWRVVLQADEHAHNIMIYPEAVRFGDLPLDVDPEEGLKQTIAGAKALAEKRERPLRAELKFLQERLPDAVKNIGDRPSCVIGVRDNIRGDYEEIVIYILGRGWHRKQTVRPIGLVEREIPRGSAYPIDAQGAVMHPDAPRDSVPFNVSYWCLPATFRGPITISDDNTGESYVFDLTSESITRTTPD